MRSFACICVLTTHAPIPGGSNGLNFIGFFNYYATCGASILFFMISGALILYKPKPAIPFIKRRLSRIVCPMFFWTIISLLVAVIHGEMSLGEMAVKIAKIPLAPQESTYWFIYAIFGIYLFTPIVASWLNKAGRRELEFYLCVWAITLLLPYIAPHSHACDGIIDFAHGPLYYFYGFLWFAVMGYYLRKYVNLHTLKRWHAGIAVLVLALPVGLYLSPMGHDIIHDRMTLHAAFTCCVYFVILKHAHYSE